MPSCLGALNDTKNEQRLMTMPFYLRVNDIISSSQSFRKYRLPVTFFLLPIQNFSRILSSDLVAYLATVFTVLDCGIRPLACGSVASTLGIWLPYSVRARNLLSGAARILAE